MHLCKMHLCKT